MGKTTRSLQFMYGMERFATAIYRMQQGGFKEKIIREKITSAVDNEHQHALNLRSRIIELHKAPFRLAFLFQLVGTLLGFMTRCLGQMFALKADVLIEKRAVKDYSYFLRTLELDDETKSLIKNIIADEELHIENWQDSIEKLKNRT